MVAPENLMDAVSRLKPRAILLLDTNTVMDAPKLDSYDINSPGPFLLVIPLVVDNELMSVKLGGRDERTKQKASRAWNFLNKLYEGGNPTRGIDLDSGRWLVTAKSPEPPDLGGAEDQQIFRNLGRVDTALLRLAAACAQDCPDTSTVLVTGDRNLTHVSKAQGLSVCRLSDLRSPEVLEKVLVCAGSIRVSNIDFSALLDRDVERPVKISMTLEELRSEGDALIAQGSGRLSYDEARFPFRWTFPYPDLASYEKPDTVDVHELDESAVMSSENLDFMGADEQLPEPVKKFVCSLLEDSARWSDTGKSLQSPLTRLRFNLVWHSAMGTLIGEPYRHRAEIHKKLMSQESVSTYDHLTSQHDRHLRSLQDGTAESFGCAYRSMFQLNEALYGLLGLEEEYDPEGGPLDLVSALIFFLDTALGTWSVGETREAEWVYSPFSWLEHNNEASNDSRQASH